MNMRPLITICGTTGVGKSELAVDLALYLSRRPRTDTWQGARIINADAMQVYRGLDIITNKIPESDRRGVEHLLLGFKAPGEQYVVGQWVQDALKAIGETHEKNQIPIVVGGTSYWIQHLIFPNRLAHADPLAGDEAPIMTEELAQAVDTLPPQLLTLFNNLPEHPPSAAAEPDTAFTLHTLLSILDPPVANRWHWRDTRKVFRSLSIIKETGRRTSDIIRDQTKDASVTKPRFRTLCFWLYAEPSILEHRLNERIDHMIERGLLNEIRNLCQIADAPRSSVTPTTLHPHQEAAKSDTDYTLGIYQSIGYREFHEYLSNPEKQSDETFKNAVERMKISTRQYAKRQISWIRNKLLPLVNSANTEENVIPVYVLDATRLGEYWTTGVRDPAISIIEGFLKQQCLPDPFSLSDNARKALEIEPKLTDPTLILHARKKLICPVCTMRADRPVMVEEGREWHVHQRTRVHRRLVMAASKDRRAFEDDGNSKPALSERSSSDESEAYPSTLFA